MNRLGFQAVNAVLYPSERDEGRHGVPIGHVADRVDRPYLDIFNSVLHPFQGDDGHCRFGVVMGDVRQFLDGLDFQVVIDAVAHPLQRDDG